MELERRLRECLSRSSAIQILEECVERLQKDEDTVGLLITLLRERKTMARHLTENELFTRYSLCLSVSPPLLIIPSISNYMREVKDDVIPLIPLINTFLQNNIQSVLENSLKADPDNDVLISSLRNWVDSLVVLVSLLLSRLPKSCVSGLSLCRQTASWVVRSVISVIQLTVEKLQKKEDVNLMITAYLIAKGRNMVDENGATVLCSLISQLRTLPVCAITDRVCERLFTDCSLGSRHAEGMMENALGYCRRGQELRRLFGLSASRPSSLTLRVSRRLLFQRECAPIVPKILAEYLYGVLNEQMYKKLLEDALCLWSDPSTISHSPLPLLKYRTRVVVELGVVTRNDSLSLLWEELFPTIARALQSYLGRPEVCVRQMGMLIGEETSKWMGKEGLKFDYEEDEFTQEMRRILRGESVQNEESEEKEIPLPIVPMSNLSISDSIQSTPSTVLSSRTTVPLDSDDEEDFEAFALPEEEKNVQLSTNPSDEPDRTHPPPSYIRECMEWLEEKEKYEKWQAAFYSMEGFIRRRAIGVNEEIDKIVRNVIHLQDPFNTKDFEIHRRSILSACLTSYPRLVPYTANVLFSRSCSMSQRYLLLEVILSAAKELSSVEKEVKKVKEVKKESPSVSSLDSSHWRHIVDARVRSNTKYFHSDRTPSTVPSSTVNHLSSSIDLFVYPLLRTTVDGEHLELMGRDSAFFARVILTASEIIQLAAMSPSMPRIASALSDIVDTISVRNEPFLVTTSMFARFAIAQSLAPIVFVQLFSSRIGIWLDWCLSIGSSMDHTPEDREMANCTAGAIAKVIQLAEKQDF